MAATRIKGKTIVFCADGTWNGQTDDEDGDGIPDQTNVLKLFLSLAGQETVADWHKRDEQEKELPDAQGNLVQIAKYLHGVGDSRNPLSKMLGGAFGAGLITRIVRGYTYLSRNYAAGDRIVLVGFSRGAYTVRALSGLIGDLGLLANPDDVLGRDRDAAYRLGVAAWYQHRKQRMQARPQSVVAALAALADDLPGFAQRALAPDAFQPADIAAIGVWDTVGSYGIPQYEHDARVDTFRFADCKLDASVGVAFHAVSIDERRIDFTPTLWDTDGRVTQVLFAGAHADVGGGYPQKESGLADCSLAWMMQMLRTSEKTGMTFASPAIVLPRPDPLAQSHAPWDVLPFSKMQNPARTFSAGFKIHRSVCDRLAEGAYRPANMQSGYVSPAWALLRAEDMV